MRLTVLILIFVCLVEFYLLSHANWNFGRTLRSTLSDVSYVAEDLKERIHKEPTIEGFYGGAWHSLE